MALPILDRAPSYLEQLYHSTLGLLSRRSLRSAGHGELDIVPFARNSIMQRRAFPVLGPTVWNGLPVPEPPSLGVATRIPIEAIDSCDTFYKSLKSVLFRRGWV